MRELSDQAHGVNLDVGAGLLNGLSTVDPADVNGREGSSSTALLGADYDDSPYTQQGERVARLAVSGIRLVIEEFRADVTKTRKDGSKGALRIDYGNGREPQEPVRWLWKYIDGAKTAGELYGRALVVIAAEQYASRLVVPQSQRTPAIRWSSHKDLAAKALAKLAAPHLPASLRQLEAAVKRAHEERDRATQRARRGQLSAPAALRRPPTTRAAAAAQEEATDADDRRRRSTRSRRATRPSSSRTRAGRAAGGHRPARRGHSRPHLGGETQHRGVAQAIPWATSARGRARASWPDGGNDRRPGEGR